MNKKGSKKCVLIKPMQSFEVNSRRPLSKLRKKENSRSSTSSSFFQKLEKKISFSSDSSKTADLSAFRSQFHHKEKDSRFDSDVSFDKEKHLASTPVAHRTRVRAPRVCVDSSKIKRNI